MGADGGVCWIYLRDGASSADLERLLAPWWYELTSLGSRTYEDSRRAWVSEHGHEHPRAVFGGYGTDLGDLLSPELDDENTTTPPDDVARLAAELLAIHETGDGRITVSAQPVDDGFRMVVYTSVDVLPDLIVRAARETDAAFVIGRHVITIATVRADAEPDAIRAALSNVAARLVALGGNGPLSIL